jgi:hypothetical protein
MNGRYGHGPGQPTVARENFPNLDKGIHARHEVAIDLPADMHGLMHSEGVYALASGIKIGRRYIDKGNTIGMRILAVMVDFARAKMAEPIIENR